MADYSNNIIEYSNKAYSISITICPDSKMASKMDNCVTLDAQVIEEISYTSELNNLVLVGHIIYIDKFGQLDKFVEQQQTYCYVMVGEMERKTDGRFSKSKIDYNRCFSHTFIVNKIQILERAASCIKYKLELISSNWYNCIANIQYSNYDKDPEPILDIIKNCISKQELVVDDETFGKVKANVKMNYMSKLNDNLFTSIPYLLHKLYFLPNRDDSLKFIYYDWFGQKYKLLDLADSTTTQNITATILSFFKSNAEMLIQQDPTNIGMLDGSAGHIHEYKNLFKKDMYSYDIKTNQFKNNEVKVEEVVQYMNSHMSYDNYVPKYHKVDSISTLKYFQSSSYWNATLNVYNDSLLDIQQNNAIVANITGDILRQCGSIVSIGLDRDMNALTDDSKAEFEKMKTKYKMFEGPWIASKVLTTINPQTQVFRQKVALFRNYMMKQKPPKEVSLG